MVFNKKDKKRKTDPDDQVIDASPGDVTGENFAGNPYSPDSTPLPPRSIRDNKTFKASSAGITRLWNNYCSVLSRSFAGMEREQQEDLITKICIIVTLGVTVVALSLFYTFIPVLIRVLAVPIALIAAWWVGGNIVSRVILGRLENLLNK